MVEPVEIVLRTVTVTVAVLLGLLLLATGRGRPAALPGACLCFAIAAFFVTSVRGASAGLGVFHYPLTALCVTKAAWFWLFARGLFRDGAAVRTSHLSVVGAVAVAGTWQQTVFLGQFRAGEANFAETVAGFGIEAALLALVLAGLYEAGRDAASDLVERRRRLRMAFMTATGVYLVATLGVQTHNLIQGVSTPLPATWANMAVVTVASLAAAWSLLKLRSENWLDPGRATATVALSTAESSVLADLKRAIDSDRVHLQEGLTIGALASRLGVGEHVLRRAINRGLGYRNFNDFLHARRIREACEELARPEQARLPVLSIAMKVGYGSIGTFNRAFKARTGMTPTAFRRNSVNGASNLR